MEREWLDMASLDESDAAGAVDETPAVPAPRDRMAPALLILLAIGWTGFALFVATDGFARAPALADWPALIATIAMRSEEHTSELQSLMRISYAVFCLKKKNIIDKT